MIKKLYLIGKILLSSAPFALLLSIVMFWFEQNENSAQTDKMLSEMAHIESSLSTRHIGIFPNFISDINTKILRPDLKRDSIIVFEDVLFYGMFSNPDGFTTMTSRLLDLAERGNDVAIAFYDNHGSYRNRLMFTGVVKDRWLDSEKIAAIPIACDSAFKEQAKHKNFDFKKLNIPREQDSIRSLINERYFSMKRSENPNEFKKKYDYYKNVRIADADTTDVQRYHSIYVRLDSIKDACLKEPYTKVTYQNIYDMYDGITEVLRDEYEKRGARLVPMRSSLIMSCWANRSDAMFAMPSRFMTDEIGFITHDKQILDYFRALIEGVAREEANIRKGME